MRRWLVGVDFFIVALDRPNLNPQLDKNKYKHRRKISPGDGFEPGFFPMEIQDFIRQADVASTKSNDRRQRPPRARTRLDGTPLHSSSHAQRLRGAHRTRSSSYQRGLNQRNGDDDGDAGDDEEDDGQEEFFCSPVTRCRGRAAAILLTERDMTSRGLHDNPRRSAPVIR